MRTFFALLFAAALGLLFPSSATADGWGYLYGAAKLTTDYRFHGFSESNRRPTVQGNVHWVVPGNWYLGIFAAHVNFLDGSTSYEIDWYGGRHFYFGDNDLNLEVLTFTFPDKAGPTPTYNAIQGSAELTHTFGALKLAGKLQGKHAHAGLGYEIDGTASYAITPWLTAIASTGYQNGQNRFGRMNWEVGATTAWGRQWLFDARYSGTNIDKAHCFFTDWCASGVNATITYQFGIPL